MSTNKKALQRASKTDSTVRIILLNRKKLAYAENRCQDPAYIYSTGSRDPLAPSKLKWVSGTPSYISLADGAQIIDILRLLAEAFRRFAGNVPYIVIAGKHGNPCGAAISWDNPLNAIQKALMGDSVAVMGGEVVTNFPISDNEAVALFKTVGSIKRENWGLDLVIAPAFSETATIILGKREKRRLLSNPALLEAPFPKTQWMYRQVGVDWLRQKAPKFVLTWNQIRAWSGKEMSTEQFENALIAFACCWRASSNTVALANDYKLIGLGCGQQDRIACVRLCLDRANRSGHSTQGSIFASDAFFPYAESKSKWSDGESHACVKAMKDAQTLLKASTMVSQRMAIKVLAKVSDIISRIDRREGTELLIDAGCAGGVVPADGKEYPNVLRLFQDNGLAVAFLPSKFRGFSKH